MNDLYKEVFFNVYCDICKYCDLSEDDEPCCECLENATNQYSHKPVNYEKRDK